MSVIHAPKRPEYDLRVLVFPGVMVSLFLVLFLRLWYIQVVKAPELVEKAEATRETRLPRPAPRGLIYDRNGQTIASVKPELTITAIYRKVQENPWVVPKVAQMLGVDEKKIRAKIRDARSQPSMAVPIYVGASIEVGAQIAEAGDELPGIGVDTQPMRDYRDAKAFSHMIGYVGIPSHDDVERLKSKGIDPANYVGKQGLERSYEAELMGTPGAEHMEIDAKRRPIRLLGRDEPVPGKQLILSIDAKLQRSVFELMAAKKYVGGVVAIAPKTGEVLCLVSSPSFDPNVFKGGISQADWDLLQNDSNNPLLNRPLGASYSPGSTFKIVTTLAAVETGKFDPNRYIYCSGGFRIGKRTFKCLGHHGSISFEKAFEKSCNTYFATLGYQVGEEAIRRAALEVGMGQKTGIDIGSESRGVVPTNEWMERWFKDPHWYGGDTVNLSIGQGYLRTTPIQMANLACLVANNGVNYRPHLVRGFIDPGNDNKQTLIQPQVAHQTKVDPGYWLALKRAMQRVVESGTGAAARIPGITWGAKTGSTEHGKGKKTHSWFIGIAPIDDPQICVCVLIEQAGHGGEIAAPIAREVVKRYLVKPTTPPKSARNDLRVPSNAASASRTEPTLSTSPDRR